MAHCDVCNASRIRKLYQKMLNNILYWNTQGFLDVSKMIKVQFFQNPPKNLNIFEKILKIQDGGQKT